MIRFSEEEKETLIKAYNILKNVSEEMSKGTLTDSDAEESLYNIESVKNKLEDFFENECIDYSDYE